MIALVSETELSGILRERCNSATQRTTDQVRGALDDLRAAQNKMRRAYSAAGDAGVMPTALIGLFNKAGHEAQLIADDAYRFCVDRNHGVRAAPVREVAAR